MSTFLHSKRECMAFTCVLCVTVNCTAIKLVLQLERFFPTIIHDIRKLGLKVSIKLDG